MSRCPSQDWDEYAAAQDEIADIAEADASIYTLCIAFTPWPVVTCFGLGGLIDTVPRLEPNLYSVLDRRGALVGDVTIAPDGAWWADVDGVRIGPGYIVV